MDGRDCGDALWEMFGINPDSLPLVDITANAIEFCDAVNNLRRLSQLSSVEVPADWITPSIWRFVIEKSSSEDVVYPESEELSEWLNNICVRETEPNDK